MTLRTALRRAGAPLLGLLALLSAIPGCAPVDPLNRTVSRDGLQVERAIPYGPGARQAMDVWHPAQSATALPVVVFFYGGAWREGDRADYVFVAASLARRGHVVVVPDYRVMPEARFPTFLQDAGAAVALARRMAPRWGGDPARLVLMGHSAGAHIAAMLALDPRWLAEAGDDRRHVAGPYDFLPIMRPDVIKVFAAARDPRDTQPVTFADAQAPPSLQLHGTGDTTVLPRNSESLAARLAAAGARSTLRLYPGVGHAGIVAGFSGLLRSASPALEDTAGFIATLAPRL